MTFTLKEIADRIGGDLAGDGQVVITGVSSLDEASPGDISFFYDPRYTEKLKTTRASALLVTGITPDYSGPQLVVPNPMLASAAIAGLFVSSRPDFTGISPDAFIDKSAAIGPCVAIYPHVYVGKEAVIHEGVTLFPGVFIGDRVEVGAKTLIYPNVTILQDSRIGSEVIIHAGCVIGSDGFGFVREGSKQVKIPQFGSVQIDDQVELGANNTVDRATFGKTWIKRGVKTDNLVHIGHNVIVGENTVIVAQTGISGSVQVGRQVIIGGQVGLSDHIKIGDNVMIGSQSGVAKSLAAGQVVSGTPAIAHRLWLKTSGLVARLPQFLERLRGLEKKVAELEKKLGNG